VSAVPAQALPDGPTGAFTAQTNLRAPSYLTVEDLDRFLRGTPLAGLGDAFMEAEARHTINARFLIALAAVEAGLGVSDLAQTRHNLFGLGAADSGGTPMGWSSFRAGIEGGAAYIANNFLNPSGRYYRGATVSGVHVFYATSPTWAAHVVSWANRIPASSAPEYAAFFDYVWMSRGAETGEPIHVLATVRNVGWRPWTAAGANAAALSLRVFDAATRTELTIAGVPRVALGRRVYNQESTSVVFAMPAPRQHGTYLLRVGAMAGDEWMVSMSRPKQERVVSVRPVRLHWQTED
jgi:hypothetical protein